MQDTVPVMNTFDINSHLITSGSWRQAWYVMFDVERSIILCQTNSPSFPSRRCNRCSRSFSVTLLFSTSAPVGLHKEWNQYYAKDSANKGTNIILWRWKVQYLENQVNEIKNVQTWKNYPIQEALDRSKYRCSSPYVAVFLHFWY